MMIFEWDDDDFDQDIEEAEPIDMGPCCACGKDDGGVTVRNLYMLNLHAPIPGTGWGCFQCGLPQDGAMAVVCDECHERGKKVRYVIYGPVTDKKRWLRNQLAHEVFDHDMSKHPEAMP